MMPVPVQDMVIDLGAQLMPFGVGGVVFALATLTGMLIAILAEVRGPARPRTRRRAALRPVSAVEAEQAA